MNGPLDGETPRRSGLRRAVKPRVRGLARWTPRKKTLDLIKKIEAVLAEYEQHLPLTIRQIFYRLVGVHGYSKTEKDYKNLCEVLNRARRAGLIEFDAIRDDGTEIYTATGWSSPSALIGRWRDQAAYFNIDRQIGQPERRIIMVEAAGMKPQIEAVADQYGIPVIASGGFDSLTAKRALALALFHRGGPTEVMHIGDLDPSGAHLFLSAAEDVEALLVGIGETTLQPANTPEAAVQFTRLVVTAGQVTALNLSTAPRKPTDKRVFDGETVQAEAIPPDELARIVTEAIEERLNVMAFDRTIERERQAREWLVSQLDGIGQDGAP
jgi:hypothetical protein